MKNKSKNINVDKKGEFIYRYKLETPCSKINAKQALADAFRKEIINLQDVVVFTINGKTVDINGFRFITDPEIFTLTDLNKNH